MIPARVARGLACAAAIALLAVGCAGRRSPGTTSDAVQADVAVYRGRLLDDRGGRERFQVTLFAARPDRVHAEVVGPVGGPRWIVDGGGGRVAITVLEERTAYVGEATRDSLRRAFGVPLLPEEWVAALLDGRAPDSAGRFLRDPPRRPGWPRRMEVTVSGTTLVLERKRTRDLPSADLHELGRGNPGDGMTVQPLDRLPARPVESGP